MVRGEKGTKVSEKGHVENYLLKKTKEKYFLVNFMREYPNRNSPFPSPRPRTSLKSQNTLWYN